MSKGFASDTGSSHRWLAGLLGRSVGSLPSAGITRLRRYYEPVRPCASHRYSAPQGSAPWRSPFASRRQVPTFRTRASRWSHAVFMPVAARPVGRLPPSFGAGQQREPGFGDVPTLSTRQQRFTHVRLTSAHLTGLLPPFAATLTTSAIGPTQLAVVWTLILQSEPEGPTLISCAARLPGVARYISHLLAPSWRTVIGIGDDVRPESFAASGEPPVLEEAVHVDDRDQRARDPALRRAARAALATAHAPRPLTVPLFDRRLEPQLDQPQHVPVHDPPGDRLHQLPVRDRVEVARQIGVHHVGIAPADVPVHVLDRVGPAATGPITIGAILEVRLEDGFQHQLGGGLDHPVPNGRDAERE